ncbi:MAG: DUF6165 family protein [Methyloligellaceae bacterium]
MMITVPISTGELLDKMTILQIKLERISDAGKKSNVSRELKELLQVREENQLHSPELETMVLDLKKINESLWDIEDRIREKEAEQKFDNEFTELARAVYITNDKRAAVKKSINVLTGSALVEEKSYKGS